MTRQAQPTADSAAVTLMMSYRVCSKVWLFNERYHQFEEDHEGAGISRR
jgi:hypothetical protein